MKNCIVLFLFIFSISGLALGNAGGDGPPFTMAGGDSVEQTVTNNNTAGKGIFEGRKPTAAIYSLIIPGSGQTMLGSPYKGFGITFIAFGSALTTLISHNNFVASNERMDALEFQYKSSTTWENSNALYLSMNDTHTKLVQYRKMRNTFAIISAVVWTLNIADVLFNTEDEGDVVFSINTIPSSPVMVAGGIFDQQQRVSVSIRID
jgi:hypothetical protein